MEMNYIIEKTGGADPCELPVLEFCICSFPRPEVFFFVSFSRLIFHFERFLVFFKFFIKTLIHFD